MASDDNTASAVFLFRRSCSRRSLGNGRPTRRFLTRLMVVGMTELLPIHEDGYSLNDAGPRYSGNASGTISRIFYGGIPLADRFTSAQVEWMRADGNSVADSRPVPVTVLVIDDEPQIRRVVRSAL